MLMNGDDSGNQDDVDITFGPVHGYRNCGGERAEGQDNTGFWTNNPNERSPRSN